MRRALFLAWLFVAAPAAAQISSDPLAPAPPVAFSQWRAEKCARYVKDWAQALARFGRAGLSENFLQRHEAFLARGCEDPREVCPRSRQELALANLLILRAMNAGAASTFPPFACKD